MIIKTISNKTITITGIGSLFAFFVILFSLNYLGINIETSGDIVCGEKCVSYFNVSVTNYSLCFSKTFNVYTEPNVNIEIYKADLRYSVDNPNRWKIYNFSGKCLNKGKYQFMLIGYKNPTQTVKWGVDLQGKDIDPYWYAQNSQTDAILINITAEVNFTHLNISTTAPYDSLILYYPFDGDKENTNGTAYDWSNQSKDGQLYGNSYINSSNCIYGDCLKLHGNITETGANEYVSITNYNYQTNEASFSFWMNPNNKTGISLNTILSGGTAIKNPIIYASPSSSGGFRIYIMNITGSTASWDYLSPSGQMTLGTWQYYTITYNTTGLYYYRNGSFIGSDTVLGTGTVAQFANIGNNTLIIGGGVVTGGGRYFNGSLDEFMIFNISLTPAQILAIYNNQSARFMPTGTQNIVNQTYMNISTGNNRVNVTTYIESLFGSSINLTIGFYNTSNLWFYTTPQVVSSGINQTFIISSTSTNLTLNYTFYAGNSTNPFYSPIIQYNITFDVWNLGGANIPDINYSVALPLGLIRFLNCSPDFENPDSRPDGQTSQIASLNATNNGTAIGNFLINLTGILNTGWTIWASNDSLINNLTLSTTAKIIWSNVGVSETKKIWLKANCSYISANPGQSINMWAV